MTRCTDAVELLDRRYIKGRPQREFQLQLEAVNADVAQLVYDLRTGAGLTQQQLADLVGTTQPAVSRLEDADYTGHSLTMLLRIATSLGKSIKVTFRTRANV